MKTHFNRIQTENCATFHRMLDSSAVILTLKMSMQFISVNWMCRWFFFRCFFFSSCACNSKNLIVFPVYFVYGISFCRWFEVTKVCSHWKLHRRYGHRQWPCQFNSKKFKATIKLRMVNWYSWPTSFDMCDNVQFFTCLHSKRFESMRFHSHSFG